MLMLAQIGVRGLRLHSQDTKAYLGTLRCARNADIISPVQKQWREKSSHYIVILNSTSDQVLDVEGKPRF
jgi:hypothetical protein